MQAIESNLMREAARAPKVDATTPPTKCEAKVQSRGDSIHAPPTRPPSRSSSSKKGAMRSHDALRTHSSPIMSHTEKIRASGTQEDACTSSEDDALNMQGCSHGATSRLVASSPTTSLRAFVLFSLLHVAQCQSSPPPPMQDCSGTFAVSNDCQRASSRGTAALPVRRASSVEVASSILEVRASLCQPRLAHL